jgi:cytochrome c-type biogenesis protein CcmH/NrfF
MRKNPEGAAMSQLLYALPLLACPVAMGLMMWFMMRSKATDQQAQSAPTAEQEQELIRLRKEVDALRGDIATKPTLRKDSSA